MASLLRVATAAAKYTSGGETHWTNKQVKRAEHHLLNALFLQALTGCDEERISTKSAVDVMTRKSDIGCMHTSFLNA